jgi:hypothetical protein
MNERERFLNLFLGRTIDRPPLLEEGVREEVLEDWHRQGLPRDQTHLERFGLTPHENIGPDLRFRSSDFGRVLDFSVDDYRRTFQVSQARFPEDWQQTVDRLENRDHIVCIWASRGFFQALGVGDWPTLEQALTETIKKPQKIRDRLRIYGDFCAGMLDLALRDVDPEFVYLSEPISNNEGPLISPAMFQDFMIPAYEAIIGAARERGCKNILVSTYGNSRSVFPALIETGVNQIWISEAAEVPELDYRALRSRFGPEIGLIGGIPLSLLRSDSDLELEKALREIVVPLLQSGRYIPLAGGRVREDIPWSVYRRYREALEGIMSQHSLRKG